MFTANYSESCPLEEETAFCVCSGTYILGRKLAFLNSPGIFFFFWQNVFIYIEQIAALHHKYCTHTEVTISWHTYELQLDFVGLSCLKRKCIVDIPHIPDRCLWSSHWWTRCSHTTLSWLHCWRRKYKLFEMWPDQCTFACVQQLSTAGPLCHSEYSWCLLSF